MRSLVNDKQAVVAQWQRYQKYSVVVEEVGSQPGPLLGVGNPAVRPASLTHKCAVVGPTAARRIPG